MFEHNYMLFDTLDVRHDYTLDVRTQLYGGMVERWTKIAKFSQSSCCSNQHGHICGDGGNRGETFNGERATVVTYANRDLERELSILDIDCTYRARNGTDSRVTPQHSNR